MKDLVSIMSSTYSLHHGLRLVYDDLPQGYRIKQDDLEMSCVKTVNDHRRELNNLENAYYASFSYYSGENDRRKFEEYMGYRK